MIRYFAYGSNMLRARLEGRVGRVDLLGPARLDGFCHSFTKLGRDGTGKGNILPDPGGVVHGVLYALSDAQMARLIVCEGGYGTISLTVVHALASTRAQSFQALSPVASLRPSAEYLDYYARGMREHDLPETYRRWVLAQGRLAPPGR